MLTVGLTGGIGSGKSLVSDLLAAAGAVVVDADRVAREVVEAGTPGLAGIVASFGAGLLLPDGSLDRESLGRRVFADPVELSVLNAIVHPLVAARTSVLLAAARAQGASVLVHDVPLLTENGLQDHYDVVVVVDAPVELQLTRLVEQRGMAAQDAQARISRQATREQRLAVADEVIRNDGTRQHLEEQVAALWPRLLARAVAGW